MSKYLLIPHQLHVSLHKLGEHVCHALPLCPARGLEPLVQSCRDLRIEAFSRLLVFRLGVGKFVSASVKTNPLRFRAPVRSNLPIGLPPICAGRREAKGSPGPKPQAEALG